MSTTTFTRRVERGSSPSYPDASRTKFSQVTDNQLAQRTFTSLPTEIMGLSSDISYAGRLIALDQFSQRAAVIADHGLGLTSTLNTIQGPIGASAAYGKASKALEREDAVSTNAALLNLGTSMVQTCYGVNAIAMRTTGIASAILPASTRLSATSALLSTVQNALLIPFSAGFGAWGIYQGIHAARFYKEYENSAKSKEASDFDFLVDTLYVHPDKITPLLYDSSLLTKGKKLLKKQLGSDYAETATEYDQCQDKSSFLNEILADKPKLLALKEFYFSRLHPEAQEQLDTLNLPTVIGLLIKLKEMEKTGQAKLERTFGTSGVDRIKQAAQEGLQLRLRDSSLIVRQKAEAEWEKMRTELNSDYKKMQHMYCMTAIGAAFGVALGVLCVVGALGPFGPIILLSVSIANVLFSLASDLKGMDTSDTEMPGRYDALLLSVGTLIVLAGMSIAIAGAIAGGSPVILALSLALGLTLLGIYGYGFYKHEKRKKNRIKELERNAIQHYFHEIQKQQCTQKVKDRASAFFSSLPRSTRHKITAAKTHVFQVENSGKAWLEEALYASCRPDSAVDLTPLQNAMKPLRYDSWKTAHYPEEVAQLEELFAILSKKSEAEHARIGKLQEALDAYQNIDRDTLAILFRNIETHLLESASQ